MTKVRGLGGVFFKSANPRGLARWYSRSLGIPLAFPAGAIFKPSSMPKPAQTVWSVFAATATYFKPSASPFMVNFVVDDVEAALEQVAANGGKVVGKVRDHPYGRFGWFLDPDGNKVELWQPPAPKQARRRRKAADRRTRGRS